MTERPLFLSSQENSSDLLPFRFELMNGYVHRLFLSFVPEGLSVSFSSPVTFSLIRNELTIDLRDRDGLGTVSLALRAFGYPELVYQVSLREKVSFDDLCGRFCSAEDKKDFFSLTCDGNISITYFSFLARRTLYFRFVSFSPLTGKVQVMPAYLDGMKFFLELIYDSSKDAFLLSLIREEYSDDDSFSRVLIGKNGPVAFLRDKEW